MDTSEAKVPATPEAGSQPAPRHPLLALREEMDRLFDDFFTGLPSTPFWRRRAAVDPWRRFQGMFEATFPTADMVEGDRDYRITAELPGMSEQEIEVALSGDVLTLKGEKRDEHEEKGANRHVSERRYGSFQRSFVLPEDADAEKVEAAFRNGVLTVTVPKRPDAKAPQRRIEIRAA
jgi:HSP20 family protein